MLIKGRYGHGHGEFNAVEAARRLGVKQATLYAYVSRGLLTRRRGDDGRSSLFDGEEVARLGERGQPRRAAGTGDFVIESELTEVADGRFRYRGMEVTKLALWRPFEEVATWLWTGSLGKDGTVQPWQATQEAVAAGTGAQTALPEGTLPLERLRVIVPAMAATDPLRLHLDSSAVVAAGRNIIAGMVDCLPPGGLRVRVRVGVLRPAGAAGQACGGRHRRAVLVEDLPQAAGSGAARRAARRDGAAGRPRACRLYFAARMAASVRADPYAVVATGLGALGGALRAVAAGFPARRRVRRLLVRGRGDAGRRPRAR